MIPNEHIVATEFETGEGVLVDLQTKQYYTLNETAMLIWQSLEEGSDVDEIIRKMTSCYKVTPEHAAFSIERTLSELQERKLVRNHLQ